MTETAAEPARVVLEGALTVRTIATAHTMLLQALHQHPAVLVDCSVADTVDLSLIQLLLAARISARQAGKQLGLAAPAAGSLLAALRQGGFLPPSGADPFWSGEP